MYLIAELMKNFMRNGHNLQKIILHEAREVFFKRQLTKVWKKL